VLGISSTHGSWSTRRALPCDGPPLAILRPGLRMRIKCDSESACGRACCGEDNPTCTNEGQLAFSTVNGVSSCSAKGLDCSRCEPLKEVPKVTVIAPQGASASTAPQGSSASSYSASSASASFFEPAAGLVTGALIITFGLSV
jgi:hypothetical protein